MDELKEKKQILDLTDTSPIKTFLYLAYHARRKYPTRDFKTSELAEMAWGVDPHLSWKRLTRRKK